MRVEPVNGEEPHKWIPAPAGTGSEVVCSVCSCRNGSYTAKASCEGPELPSDQTMVTAHDYDPMP